VSAAVETGVARLRPYQERVVDRTLEAYAAGTRRICIVSPPGSGKTTIAAALVHRHVDKRVLWLANRIELIEQAATRLREWGLDVGCISPQHSRDPWAPVQVASIDTLVSRNQRPPAGLVVKDEAHHAPAETYSEVLASYQEARHLGLTATPQRQDGKALDGHYDLLLKAADYSELLADGHLVKCRVATTREDEGYLGSGIAQDPLTAWRAMPEGPRPTFAFAPTVEKAYEWAESFRAAGITSACLEGNTTPLERAEYLDQFRSGTLSVLWNVYVLTEGTDVPGCSCVLLARGVSHAGPYLQITGRALRPAAFKTDARLIDLSGAFWLHGAPTADREYSLDGRPIRAVGEALKNCQQCGACVPSATPECPECGFVWPQKPRPKLKIWDVALQWEIDAASGDPTAVSDKAKRREWDRLVGLMNERSWSLGFIRKEYETLFACAPPAEWVAALGEGVQARELAKLESVAKQRGYKPGWVSYRYKAMFGHWPRRRA